MAFSFYRTITIDHTLCGTTDSTDFPVLVKLDSSNCGTTMKTAANGGHIQNTVSFNGQTVPADLAFYSDSGGTSLLSWDVESYDATNGIVWAWVKIPTLSHTVDTVFYAFYDDTGVTTYQGGAVGAAYDANFKGVWHLPDGSTLAVTDSTANGNNGTNHGATAGTGQVDGGAAMSQASTQYISIPDNFHFTTALTYSAWVKATTLPNAYNSVIVRNGANGFAEYFITSAGKMAVYTGTGNYDGTGSHTLSTGTWYHTAFTFDSVNGIIGYVNGVSDNTAAVSGALVAGVSNNDIGQDETASPRSWNGVIDEARISNSVRAPAWILTEYNNQNAPLSFHTIGTETSVSPTPPSTAVSTSTLLSLMVG